MIKVSVIVIIYKIEKYLSQCIESILAQTYKEFELILVDDGSPDNCPQICDEYAKKDKRIKVIHQSNQGSVIARWNGVLASGGEYISLIDGDDWLDPDMYEKMMGLAERNDADIVITGYKEGSEENYKCKRNITESGLYDENKINQLYKEALYTGEFYEPGVIPALWNKLIRRKLLFENYVPAEPCLKMGEDAAVSYPMLARAKTIVIDNEFCPYHYRILEGSMSRKYDPEYFDRCVELFSGLSENLEVNKAMHKCLKFYALFIIKIGFLRLCSKQSLLSIIEQKKIATRFYKDYCNIGINMDYAWELIGEDKIWLMQFMRGHIWMMLCTLYIKKLVNKVKKNHGN